MQFLLSRMIGSIQKYAKATIAVVVILSIGFAFAAVKIQFDADYTSLLPPTEDNFIMPEEAAKDTVFSTDHIVMVESDNLYTPETLTAITVALDRMAAHPSVGSSFSAFDFVTVESRGTRLLTVPMSTHSGDAAWTQAEADLFKQRLMNDDIVKSLLVSDDGRSLVFVFTVNPNIATALTDYEEIWKPVRSVASVYVTGGATINERVMTYLTKDLTTLLILCFIVILIIYYLSFRAKRAMFIPFSLSFISIIWTFGIMSLLDFPMTIINVITPCLVLTLGSSYSIHVLTEYFQSFREGNPDYIRIAVSKIGKTIFLACITDIVGFMSLLTSQTDAFKEFGISVSIGISICAILSVTYLPAVLTITIEPQSHQMNLYKNGLIAKISSRIARIIVRRWPWFLLLFSIVVVGFFATKDHIGLDANYMSYLPKKDPLVIDSQQLTDNLKGTNNHYITLDAPDQEKGYFLKPEVIKQVYAFEQLVLKNSPDVAHIISFPSYVSFMNRVSSGTKDIPETPGIILLLSRYLKLITTQLDNPSIKMLLNEDASRMTITLRVYDSKVQNFQSVASATRVDEVLLASGPSLPEGVKMTIWGEGKDAIRFSTIIMDDQQRSIIVSFILVFAITVLAFRSLKIGIFSVIPILVGIMANYIFMFVTGIPFDMITVGFTSVTIGVGIDNALHFLIRYDHKRKLNRYVNVRVHLQQTIRETGRPILLTTLSIVSGLAMLSFGSYTPIRYFGLLVSISLINTMLATLFILPSVIIMVEELPRKRRKRLKNRSLGKNS
ncbi:MAG: RND transporter [Spirochaetae bacterium HGW-Spirochaetae-8]|nr:MAG: RND transporter [Spirochaetae bacterium HGW-Spirochaetae-8]